MNFKKTISCLLLSMSLVNAMEGDNSFPSTHAAMELESPFGERTPITSRRVGDPFEIDMPYVALSDGESAPTPWYKSKRFWMGAAIGATVAVSATVALMSWLNDDGQQAQCPPFPSSSPWPSVSGSFSSSWTSSLSESVTRSLTATFSSTSTSSLTPSPTQFPSAPTILSCQSSVSYCLCEYGICRVISHTSSPVLNGTICDVFTYEAQYYGPKVAACCYDIASGLLPSGTTEIGIIHALNKYWNKSIIYLNAGPLSSNQSIYYPRSFI